MAVCAVCREPLPADARSDKRFCSTTHRVAAHKARREAEAAAALAAATERECEAVALLQALAASAS